MSPICLLIDYLRATTSIVYPSKNRHLISTGDAMNYFLRKMVTTILLPAAVLVSAALAQSRPPESVDLSMSVSGSPSSGASLAVDRSSVDRSSKIAPSSNTTASSAPAPAAPLSAIKPGEALLETPDSTLASITPLPELPSVSSHNKVSLIGGTVEKMDRVRDEFTVRVYGGGKVNIYFDPRTHIYRNGSEASLADLRAGDRVSIDTMLDGGNIFARTIRLKGATNVGESQGVVVSYSADSGELMVRDRLSPQPLRLRVTSQTRLVNRGQASSASELVRGTLVAVKFDPQKDGHDVAKEVSVLAIPGTKFTFVGEVTGLDLSSGTLMLTSANDGKTYEIYLGSSANSVKDKLRQAANVTVITQFDGDRYVAQNVTVNQDSH